MSDPIVLNLYSIYYPEDNEDNPGQEISKNENTNVILMYPSDLFKTPENDDTSAEDELKHIIIEYLLVEHKIWVDNFDELSRNIERVINNGLAGHLNYHLTHDEDNNSGRLHKFLKPNTQPKLKVVCQIEDKTVPILSTQESIDKLNELLKEVEVKAKSDSSYEEIIQGINLDIEDLKNNSDNNNEPITVYSLKTINITKI